MSKTEPQPQPEAPPAGIGHNSGTVQPSLESLFGLIPDEELARICACSRRTLARLEKQPDGLGYTMIAGRKYRSIDDAKRVIAAMAVRPNPVTKGRRRPARPKRPNVRDELAD